VPVVAEDYLKDKITHLLARYGDAQQKETTAAGVAKFLASSPEKQAAIKAALGL